MSSLKKINAFAKNIRKLDYLPLLVIRIVLAYGFLTPALLKWQNIKGIADWFENMNYPLPHLSAYLAATTEALGVILLALGLGIRYISVPLIFMMFVAIFTVHAGNGFNAGDNGFEIPLYYAIMLFTLLIFGSGKLSLDYLINKRK